MRYPGASRLSKLTYGCELNSIQKLESSQTITGRGVRQLEYKDMESLLIRWGDWHERHDLEPSLPQSSAFTRIYCDHPAGDRILCAEMERAVYLLNIHVLCLQERLQDSLLIWYAVNLKPQGGFWSAEEKALKLKTSVRALKLRVMRAKKALRHKIIGNHLQKRDQCAISERNLSVLSPE